MVNAGYKSKMSKSLRTLWPEQKGNRYYRKSAGMTNENHPKVRDLLDNYDNYMQQLIAMTDKVPEKKLHLARIQMQMALEQKKFVEVDVLYLFWKMIVEARVKRMEMGIEDEEEPKVETTKKSKKRKEELFLMLLLSMQHKKNLIRKTIIQSLINLNSFLFFRNDLLSQLNRGAINNPVPAGAFPSIPGSMGILPPF